MGEFSKKLYAVAREAVNFREMVRSVNLWDGRRVSKSKTFWETNYLVENFGIVRSIILWNGRRLRIILQKYFGGEYFSRNLWLRRTQKISRDYIRFTT